MAEESDHARAGVIVADVNVIAYLLVTGEKTEQAQRLFEKDPAWKVPRFWRAEFLNVLALQVQHAHMTRAVASETWTHAMMRFAPNEKEIDEKRVLEIATRHRVTAYDAHYITLAQELGVRCVSEDRELQAKFPKLVASMAGFLASRKSPEQE